MADQILRQQASTLGPTVHNTDRQISQMNDHARSLQIQPPQLPQMDPIQFMDSDYMGEWDSYMAGDFMDFQDMSMMDPMMADELFIPNAIDGDFFADDQEFQDEFANDKDFEEFLKGKRKEYKAKEEKKKKWLKKKEKELNKKGLTIKVNPDGTVTVTNSKFTAAHARPVIRGQKFQKFMQGKLPSYRGRSKTVSEWLVRNRKRLEAKGLKVHLGENGRYLITNTKFRKAAVNPLLFRGSGFRGKSFESFLDGISAKLEGNNLYRASWLYRNQAKLRKAGFHVHVELNSKGRPTGRYSVQNGRKLPPLSRPQRKALVKALTIVRSEYLAAKSLFAKARALRKSGKPADIAAARKLAQAGMLRMRRALLLHSALKSFIGLSRLLHAKRKLISRLPKSQQAVLLPLLKKADSILSKGATGTAEQLALSFRKASFILGLTDTNLFLAKTKGVLKLGTRKEILSFLNKAAELFSKNTPQSFERAQFLLAQTRRFTALSLERDGVRKEDKAARNVKVILRYAKRMKMFHTKGVFDPEKFKKLTGVDYSLYEKGSKHSVSGLGTLISARCKESLAHYDNALSGLRKLIKIASEQENVPASLVKSTLRKVSHEHRMAAFKFARTAQLEPLFRSTKTLFWMFSRLPGEKSILELKKLGLGDAGVAELRSERKQARRAMTKAIWALGRSMFYTLAAQNSKGPNRKKYSALAQKAAKNAQAYVKKFLGQSNRYSMMHADTKLTINYLRSLAKAATRSSGVGSSLLTTGIAHLKDLKKDKTLLKSLFLRIVANPSHFSKVPLPHKAQLMKYVKRIGIDVLKVLYSEKSSPAEIKAAIQTLLKKRMKVLTIKGEDLDYPAQYKRVTMSVKDALTKSNTPAGEGETRYHLDGVSAKKKKEIWTTLQKALKNPASLSVDQRRQLLLDLMKLPSDPIAVGYLEKFNSVFDKWHKSYFDAHIKMLVKQKADLPFKSRSVSNNADLIIWNLRPSKLGLGSGPYGLHIEFGDHKSAQMLYQMRQDLGRMEGIPDQMIMLVPNLDKSLPKEQTKALITLGTKTLANYQKYRKAGRRRLWITGGALLGATIAAPFTAGQSFWAAAGTIGLGVGIGMSIPSLTFAYIDYVEIHENPKATAEQKAEATKKLTIELIIAGTMALSLFSVATRAWAVGRGSLALARLGYGAEIIASLGAMGLGGYQVHQGYKLIRKGKTGWGAFNIGMGVLGLAGGGLGVAGGIRSWKTLSSLKLKGATPAQTRENVAKFLDENLANLSAGNKHLETLSAGKSTAISKLRLASIEKSYQNLEAFLAAGGRLSQKQMKIFSTFKTSVFVQPAKDARQLKKFYRLVSKRQVVSPNEIQQVIKIKRRMEAVQQFRRLSSAELKHLSKLDKALMTIYRNDTKYLERFAKMAKPSASNISSAMVANTRMALLQRTFEASGVLPKERSAVSSLSNKLGNRNQLAEFVDDIMFGTASTKSQALSKLRLMHPEIRSQVAGMVKQALRDKSIAANLPRAERVKLLWKLNADFASKISAANTKIVAQGLDRIHEATAILKKMNAGENVIFSKQHIAEIKDAYAYIKAYQKSGQKLTPKQATIMRKYDSLILFKRVQDVRALKQAVSALRGKTTLTPELIGQAASARRRLHNLQEFVSLNQSQSRALKNFDKVVAQRISAETKVLSEFNSSRYGTNLQQNLNIGAEDIKAAIESRNRLVALGKAHGLSDTKNEVLNTFNRNLEALQKTYVRTLQKGASATAAQRPSSFGQLINVRKNLGQFESFGLLSDKQKALLRTFDTAVAKQAAADVKVLLEYRSLGLKELGTKFQGAHDASQRLKHIAKLRTLTAKEKSAMLFAKNAMQGRLLADNRFLSEFSRAFAKTGKPSLERMKYMLEIRKRLRSMADSGLVKVDLKKTLADFEKTSKLIFSRDIELMKKLGSGRLIKFELAPEKLTAIAQARARVKLISESHALSSSQLLVVKRADKAIEEFVKKKANLVLEMQKKLKTQDASSITVKNIRDVADANTALAPFVSAGILSPANQGVARSVIGWMKGASALILVPVLQFRKKCESKPPGFKSLTQPEVASALSAREKFRVMAGYKFLSEQHKAALSALEKTMKLAIAFDTKLLSAYLEAKKSGVPPAAVTESAKAAYKRLLLYGKSNLLSTEQRRTVAKFKLTYR